MEQPPASDAADWSKLPTDTLISILCCLEFPDLFSSAAVCTSWRATARDLRCRGRIYTRPQTPCLFYISPAGAELYSLAAGRSYRLPDLPDPPVADRYIWGSSHGWLVTADARSELQLLNPATGEQIGLPPVATIDHVTPVHNDAGALCRYDLSFYTTLPRKETQPPKTYEVGELREVLYLKAVLSCDPSLGDCTVMLIHNPDRQLSFARVGDEQWHWITTSPLYAEYSDCIYQDDAFYAMTRQGGIHRYTIAAGSCPSCDVIFKDTLSYTAYNVYIARAPSGDLLQIWRFTDIQSEEPNEMHTDGFEIYKVDLEKQSFTRIDTLGDDALLIGHSYTCCLPAKDYPKLLPGHVYFTDDSEYWLMERKHNRRDIGIYNLEDESSGDLVSPQTWLNWPNPIWITPNFMKINQ